MYLFSLGAPDGPRGSTHSAELHPPKVHELHGSREPSPTQQCRSHEDGSWSSVVELPPTPSRPFLVTWFGTLPPLPTQASTEERRRRARLSGVRLVSEDAVVVLGAGEIESRGMKQKWEKMKEG